MPNRGHVLPIRGAEIARYLMRHGYRREVRAGSHEVYRHPDGRRARVSTRLGVAGSFVTMPLAKMLAADLGFDNVRALFEGVKCDHAPPRAAGQPLSPTRRGPT